MHTRLGPRVIVPLLLGLLPCAAAALDANGKWRFDAGGVTQIVPVTQTGSALSFTVFGYAFSGSVTPAGSFTSYIVSASSPTMSSGFGRFMPSGNLLDGRFAVAMPGGPPSVGGLIATRCTCDDGNTTNGDGCDAECRVEPCWTCVGDPSVCTRAADGSACEDGAVCTTGETCTGGVCGGGTPVSPCIDMNGVWNRHTVVVGYSTYDTATGVVQRGTDLVIDNAVGTIDSATGAFEVRAANPNLFCSGFDRNVGSVAADGLTYAADGHVEVPDPIAPDHCDIFDVSETGTRCGSGTVDLTEACDDGNLTTGDGCSAACQVEQCWTCSGNPSTCTPLGSGPCDDGNECTTNDTCTGSTCTGTPVSEGTPCASGSDPLACTLSSCTGGSCVTAPFDCDPCLTCVTGTGCAAQPRSPCKESTLPERSLLRFRNVANDSRDALLWILKAGDAMTVAEFGDPMGGDEYDLCIYDESSPTLLFRGVIAGGDTCPSCWNTIGERTLRYRSSSPPEGIAVMSLRSGPAGSSRAMVKGKGVHLSDHPGALPAPPVALPLRVQLHASSGLCLETRHTVASVLRNDAASGMFKGPGAP